MAASALKYSYHPIPFNKLATYNINYFDNLAVDIVGDVATSVCEGVTLPPRPPPQIFSYWVKPTVIWKIE